MRIVKPFLMLVLFGFYFPQANATIDYLSANHLTQELYIYSEEEYRGILWKVLSGEEKSWSKNEKFYLEKGYTYTKYPYKSDLFLVGLGGLAIGLILLVPAKRKSNRVT